MAVPALAEKSTAEEEAAYINALKEALDLRSKENDGEMPVHRLPLLATALLATVRR